MDGNSSYARTINGEVYAWGDNSYGQLGIGNTENQSSPVKIESLSNVDEIYYDGSCCSAYAKTITGEVYAWGNNSYGQLGIGNTTYKQSTPQKIEGLTNVEEIYAEDRSVYAKTTTGEVYAWGNNSRGQLGIGNTEDQSRPVKIEEYGNTQSIKRFYRSSNMELHKNIILTDDEKIYVWSFVIVPR